MTNRHAVAIAVGVHAVLMFTAYFGLTAYFDFPDVLRRPPGEILDLFSQNETKVRWFYAAFMWSQVAFALVVLAVNERLGASTAWIRAATPLGVIAGFSQAIGFSRWPFVVPSLADAFSVTPQTSLALLEGVHQLAGVAIGEHLFFCFESLWVLGLASHTYVAGAQVHVTRAQAFALGAIGASIAVYGLEQFGGVFAVLSPINIIAHAALLFWLIGFAISQWQDRPLKRWETVALVLLWLAIVV